MDNEAMGVHGAFVGTLIKADGTVQTFCKDNLILNSGIDAICNCLAAENQPAPFGYIAVGTGTTEAEAAQTALTTEMYRKAVTYTHTAGTSFFTLSSVFNPGEATGAITEAGVCNASTGGIFFDRVVFPVINKGDDDTYTATFKITFNRA